MAQLKTNVASIDLTLSADVVAEIDAVHKSQPNPCP
jgi:aryl-alcohol dehydrogenase-like predicted oxidoreductase